MTESDDGLFAKGVQNATGLSPIKHETRKLVGTEDSDEDKRKKRRERQRQASGTPRGFGEPTLG